MRNGMDASIRPLALVLEASRRPLPQLLPNFNAFGFARCLTDDSRQLDEAECLGERRYREIRVVDVTPDQLVTMATDTKEPATLEKAFFSGNPSVGVTHGLLHLLKDVGDVNEEAKEAAAADNVARPSILCMLCVPAHLTVADLANLVAGHGASLQEIKIIRDSTPNQFMVLLQFDGQSAADQFYSEHNGVSFNSVEADDKCCLAYVAKVETLGPGAGARFPIREMVELPTCPVCLERLDEPLGGVLTILCNHSFHIRCLDKWDETSCPVCRFVQTPPPTGDNRCSRCGQAENLWICLVCGSVGCGRYAGGHAYEHFTATSHTFALELGTDRVWDYCGDNFVHRLVQNKSDGKLVQIGGGRPGELDECDDKLDAMTLEYTYLLTSQLESQRLYFEEQLKRQERSFNEALSQAEVDSQERMRATQLLEATRKEKSSLEKKLAQTNSKLQKVQRELEDERGINASITANQKEYQARLLEVQSRYVEALKKKDEEIAELRDEVRDLYLNLEAKEKLAAQMSAEEMDQSHVVISEGQGAAGVQDRKKRRSGKKN